MKTPLENEMDILGRDGRLVAEALYHITILKDHGFVSGGEIQLTNEGRALGKAIADTKEFTQDEINAAAAMIMMETGGIGLA